VRVVRLRCFQRCYVPVLGCSLNRLAAEQRGLELSANAHDAVLARPYLSKLLAESRGAGLTRTRGEAPFLSPRSRSGPPSSIPRDAPPPPKSLRSPRNPYELQTKSD
jgi:hypothetical protein